jgi:ligand-binding sensor domain-containing protein
MPCITHLKLRTLLLLLSLAFTSPILAQVSPTFNIMKSSTTGIPGEEVQLMTFDPQGNLWVAARWTFFSEGGLAMLSADQLPHQGLPGGGFDTGIWKVWSNVHYPIPTPFNYDLEFAVDGTAWLANEGGLVRFRKDAATPAAMWKTFNSANTSMAFDEVRSIAIDNSGIVWFVNSNPQDYNYGRLFKLNPATEEVVQVPIQGGHQAYGVDIARNGDILISIRTFGGVARLSGNTWTYIPPGGAFGELVEDAQGNLWGHSSAAGVYKWNGSAWQNWPELGGTTDMTDVSLDNSGVIHVTTWSGAVFKFVNDTPVQINVNVGPITGDLIFRPGGEIWITNQGGNGHLGTVRHYTANWQLLERLNVANTGLGDYFIDRITSDSRGDLWFMSGENGMSRMTGSDGSKDRPTKWRNWGAWNYGSEPYPWVGSEPMNTVFEDANGIYWLGGNGIARWDSNTDQITNFWNHANSNVDTANIMGIVRWGGKIWIGMAGSGMMYLEGNTWNRVLLSNPWTYIANDVRAIDVDTAGNLWVASSYGLRRFAPGQTTYALFDSTNSPIPAGTHADVLADRSGGIWVSGTDGITRFDGTTWTHYNQAATGMPGVHGGDIAQRESDGLLAFANTQGNNAPYTGGITTYDGQTWRHYTPQNSPLPHWQVLSVEFDREGDLWAGVMGRGVVEIKIGNRAASAPTFDFDGDRKTDLSVFRSATSGAEWWYNRSSDGVTRATVFGVSTDVIAPADFTGDGKTDVTFFRPSTGQWFVLRSEDSSFFAFPFGANGDVPVPADFDADGKADAAVFRPSGATWFVQKSSGGTDIVTFGSSSDSPTVADYDGDGKADIAISRSNGGNREWWVRRSSNGSVFALVFGTPTDKTVQGDYTGDGKADIAFFRPSNGNWFVLRSKDLSFFAFPFGSNGDIPVPGDYDGDGKNDAAVFRPSSATWFANKSAGGTLIQVFGSPSDVPLPSAYVR